MTDFYHVYIKLVAEDGQIAGHFRFNIEKEIVERQVVSPYLSRRPFLFCGEMISFSRIERLVIYSSDVGFQELVLPNGKRIMDEQNNEYIAKVMCEGKVKGARVAYSEFDIAMPVEEPTRKQGGMIVGKKDKVFIVHGRDDRQALLLQKYLRDKLKFNAVVFDDLPDKGRTIIEQLEYIGKNVHYAFVVVTADDVGGLREGIEDLAKMIVGLPEVKNATVSKIFEMLQTRGRQNVVFELGLFMGALGREKVCCLLQKNVQEKPSDILGILYKPFEKSVTEVFHELPEELEQVQTK